LNRNSGSNRDLDRADATSKARSPRWPASYARSASIPRNLLERVVARTHAKHDFTNALAHDVPGFAHDDAEGFCFVGARDHATVFVGQHHERHTAQFRLKHALAACIEVVAVHERDWGWHGLQHADRPGPLSRF
jgi:hypothetical protein